MEALLKVIEELGRAKDMTREEMVVIIRESLKFAYKRKFGIVIEAEQPDIEMAVEIDAGKLLVFVAKTVVEEVVDEHLEISLEEAKELLGDDTILPGDIVDVSFDAKKLGRFGAQIAKEQVFMKIKNLEQDRIFDEYKEKQGELFTAIVLRKQRLRGKEYEEYMRDKSRSQRGEEGGEPSTVVVDLGKGEAVIPPRHQSPRDNYYRGMRMKVYIDAVRKDGTETEIVASRSQDNLLRGLFALEVPEVANGTVEIVSVARDPGNRAKVSVRSKNPDIDPVGTCVGVRGMRIQNIVRELNGERIDVIEYCEDPRQYIERALKIAAVTRVSIFDTEDRREAYVVVPDEQYTSAIGKNGQNVKLTSRLTKWRIFIFNETKYHQGLEQKREEDLAKLKSLPGMTGEMLNVMFDAGIHTVEDIAHRTVAEVKKLEGMTQESAELMIEAAKELAMFTNSEMPKQE